MSRVESFSGGEIESLAHVAGEFGTGADISRILTGMGVLDGLDGTTKWKRLYRVFADLQGRDQCANRVLDLIGALLEPARFTGRKDEFERHRESLNEVLLLRGIEYDERGRFQRVRAAETLTGAEGRARAISEKLRDRRIHRDVSRYCHAELMQENYFHAVFEAVKGLADRIRDMSGVDGDGAQLVDDVFLGDDPALAINTLQTKAEQEQQRGFGALLKACFATVRNPLAHEPKIYWQGEDDVADYFTMVSLAHFKLDKCVSTRPTRYR